MDKQYENGARAEKKKRSPKLSITIAIIGLVVMIVGIVVICIGASQIKAWRQDYNAQQAQYKIASDEWWSKVENGEATMADKPAIPDNDPPLKGIFVTFGGVVVLAFGLWGAMIGLSPFIIKTGVKLQKETLDVAGKDISELGVQTIDVAEPIMVRGAQVVGKGVATITPSVVNAIHSAKNGGEAQQAGHTCVACGAKIKENASFCSKCGAKQKIVCECGNENKASDTFCEKCGKKLQ
mgnify:CR=1 FL=1